MNKQNGASKPTGRGRRRGHGEGTIEKLKSGKFRATIPLGKDPVTGKRRRLRKTFDTEREAIRWRNQRLAERDQGRLAEPGKTTLGEYLQSWLTAKRQSIEPTSWASYRQRLELHTIPRIGQVRLTDLTPEVIEAFYDQLAEEGISSPMRRKIAGTLRMALKEAERRRKIVSNPAMLVARPKADPPEMKSLTLEQAHAFLKAADTERLAPLFRLALDSGMRLGELLALRWSDLEWTKGTVAVVRSLQEVSGHHRLKDVKTGSRGRRVVSLTTDTLAALKKHRAANPEREYMFTDRNGGFLRQSNLTRMAFRRVLERAGIPRIRFHDLRHTCATLALSQNAPIKAVSERLGHANIEMTLSVYSHVLPNMQEQVVQILNNLLNQKWPTDGPQEEKQQPEDGSDNEV